MRFYNLWYYINGYIKIKLTGPGVEKLLNLLLQNKMFMWDVYKARGYLVMKMGVKDFLHMRPYVRAAGCKVKILGKYGLPFQSRKLIKRKAFIMGGIGFVLILLYLSNLIWIIEIEGNDLVSDEEIKAQLESYGLKRGVKKQDIDLLDLEEKLPADFDEILWAGVELQGSRIDINIVEKDVEPDVLRGPTNIVADQEAFITDMVVFSGYAVVEEGHVVKPGDEIIIGRVVPSEAYEEELTLEELYEYPETQARGIVEGEVHYTGYGEADIVTEKRIPTGEEHIRYGLKTNTSEWFWDLKELPFVEYDKKKTVRSFEVSRLDFKVELVRETYIEVERHEVEKPLHRAIALAKEEAFQKAMRKMPEESDIIDKKYQIIDASDDDLARVKGVLVAKEQIGEEIEMIN